MNLRLSLVKKIDGRALFPLAALIHSYLQNHSVGTIEICENEGGDLLAATNLAAELTRYLMEKYNIPLSNVVQHNYWSGKNCPARIRKGQPYTWYEFLERVEQKTSGDTEAQVESLLKENKRLKAVLLEIENLVEGVNV